jgi:class 3 adenylate cyclase/tetratricopeptide (TPR) repeat protein
LEEKAGAEPAAAPKAAPEPAGERRQVTILFADLVGYTRLSAELDPEETHALLGRFFEAVDGAVESFGGTVDKHIGDNVMAVFGAPVAHGNDPERAVRAALAIHEAMPEVGEALGRPLQVHVGVASGQVVASGTGSASHQEYTVTGDSVNLASRLQDMARGGETLISDAVHRSVGALVDCEAVGDVELKGIRRPVPVWRLKSLKSVAGADARLPFVGRRAEMRQFAGVIEGCLESSAGQTVHLRGEIGIGKTRLVDEFRAVAQHAGLACHRGLVLDFGVGKGQDAVHALVRSLLGLSIGTDEGGRQVAADQAIASGLLDADRRVFLNDLLDLSQAPETLAVYDAMDDATRNDGKRETLAALIKGLSARQPLLIAVEDIHWADGLTLAHLASISANVATCQAILVMTSRIEGDPLDQAWRAAAHGSPLMTIDLAPLRDDEAAQLAGQIIDATTGFAATCIERAEGNPLFLEQLLRTAEEPSEDDVPSSVQSIVQARMDNLDPGDKQALQAASVLGQRFSLEALRYLAENPQQTCGGLIEHFLVRPEGDDYLFAHALVREGAYSSLLKVRRTELHRRAAAWFEEREPVLHAEHLDRAEDAGAARAYLEAGRVEAEAFRYDRSRGLLARGIELAEDPGDVFALTRLDAELLRRQGEPRASITTYQRAMEFAQTDVERCRAWIGIAAGVRLLGGGEEGVEALDKAEALTLGDEFDRERSQIHLYRGNFFFAVGDIDHCLEQQELALAYARRIGDTELEARALGGLGDAHYARGEMNSALGYFRSCIDRCREHGFGRIEVGNRYMVGVTRRYMNEFEDGLAEVLAAVDMADRVGNVRAQMYALNLVGEFLNDRGEPERAEVPLADAMTRAETLENRRFMPYVMSQQARGLLLRDRRDEAMALIVRALEISRETGVTFIAPRVLGVMALAVDDPARRQALLDEGCEVLARGCAAHNHLWFYRDAIDASLLGGEWGAVERYAELLEEFTRGEPLPWSDLVIRRGRALVAWGREARSATVQLQIEAIREEAEGIGMRILLPDIERALAVA